MTLFPEKKRLHFTYTQVNPACCILISPQMVALQLCWRRSRWCLSSSRLKPDYRVSQADLKGEVEQMSNVWPVHLRPSENIRDYFWMGRRTERQDFFPWGPRACVALAIMMRRRSGAEGQGRFLISAFHTGIITHSPNLSQYALWTLEKGHFKFLIQNI